MARKPTKAELENKVHALEAYREAFWCIEKGLKREIITSGEHTIELLGAERASGGVVIQGIYVYWAGDFQRDVLQGSCLYLRDIAHKITRAQRNAIQVSETLRV